MIKKYFSVIAFLFPFAMMAQENKPLAFSDVWIAFNTKTANIETFMQWKGYFLDEKKPNQWIYKNIATDLKATISFTYYDSSRISGITFEVKNEQTASVLKDMAVNNFVTKDSIAMPAIAATYSKQNILEFENAKYMLFCAVTTAYPRKELSLISYAWHDLVTQSLVVVQKGHNPYLVPALVADYETTPLDTFKINPDNRFEMISESATFKGGKRGMYIYLNDNVRYPEAALQDSMEGFITVRFTINKTGKAINAKVIRGKELGHGIPEEAIRLVNAMPLWKPALQLGRIVEPVIEQKLIFKMRLNNLL
jgi:TonB family protein